MRHLGDVSKLNGAEIPPVYVLTFGAPCQDLSVAGKRKLMKHKDKGDDETTRSGLFYEACRIIKEMRSVERRVDGSADVVRLPRFCVYENVPGAYEVNTFRAVLEELARCAEPGCVIPLPPKNKWPHAGCIAGNGWSIAWRTMDAQYFGVPQRRRRVCVLLSFDEELQRDADPTDNNEAVVDIGAAVCGRASEILFERESGNGDIDEGFTPWKGIARDPQEGLGECDSESDYTLQVRCGKPGGAREL